MRMFGMCIDKRVVAGAAAVGLLVWAVAPGTLAAAVPFLLVAICPLSMLLMMKMMNSGGRVRAGQHEPTVPVHPDAARPAPSATATGPPAAAVDVDARWN
jgi:hypothetical protein